jgi:hypothetical protein
MGRCNQALRVEDCLPTAPPGPDHGTDTVAEAAPGRAMARLDELAARVRAFELHMQETTAGTLRLVSDIKRNPPGNLDAIIEQLQEIEERSAGQLLPVLRDFETHREIFARDPNPRFRLKATTLVRRHEEAIVASLETLRDARWQLMAFRAELEHQRGETFTDSEELLRHLRDP